MTVKIDFFMGACPTCEKVGEDTPSLKPIFNDLIQPLRRCLSSTQLFLCDKCCTYVESARDKGGVAQK
jgi:hypothetical protein